MVSSAEKPSEGSVRKPLKLRAEDAEDLGILSAILQDALVSVGDITYLPDEKLFVLVANRFRREMPSDTEFERTLTGFRAATVGGVQRQGFDPRDKDRILVLLALRMQENALLMDFAGGASIRLEVERILCHLDDLGEPWPTQAEPRHPVEEGSP
jgi:hypothetical protein